MILSVAASNLFYFGLLGCMYQGEEFNDDNNDSIDIVFRLVACCIPHIYGAMKRLRFLLTLKWNIF